MKFKFNKKSLLSLLVASSLVLCHGSAYVGDIVNKNNDKKTSDDIIRNREYYKLVGHDQVCFLKESGAIVTDVNLWLRNGPGIEGDKLELIPGGVLVNVYGVTPNGWYLIDYKGVLGFAYSKNFTNVSLSEDSIKIIDETISNLSKNYIDINQHCDGGGLELDFSFQEPVIGNNFLSLTGIVYANKNVNFREMPGYDGKKIGLIDQGIELKLLGMDNGWYLVEYQGKKGYVLSDYVSFNKDSKFRDDFFKVVYVEDECELKSEPYEWGENKYYFTKYEVCEVIREHDGWYFIRYEDLFGYIRKENTKEISDEAVVVNVDAQRLILYNDGKIQVDCDIVTGRFGVFDTPTGMYSIKNKVENTNLISEEYGYNQPVDYWMPFNGGIGLHDASWRSSFGGNVYIKNGSHGCVNIPPKYADDVYYNVKKGTKVIVHR